ncbi:hypothetical protein [Nocardia carnea]|uniref:hypothetical protein n=1 Tax=Nocardia carnea TaxID=37328 RepID=UPI00245504A1|nr:hypothetical protein [Nocardia carnea]
MSSIDRPDPEFSCGVSWVRIALQQCRALEIGRAVDAATLPLVGFAIRWAPFGGAGAEEIFLKFGVTRQRFLELVAEALRPRGSDDPRTRQLKRHLQESLARAWWADPGDGARSGPPAAPSTRGRPTAAVRSGSRTGSSGAALQAAAGSGSPAN